jgi:peptide-methionine (R)-S-oxide reductase
MRKKKTRLHALLKGIPAIVIVLSAAPSLTRAEGPMMESPTKPEKIENAEKLSSEDWKHKLTDQQYYILRKSGTEAAHGPVYQQFKKQGAGTYYCAGCGEKLFSSKQKFDAHCGWPSFWDPAEIDSVETRVDNAFGMRRIEVVCANCKGHLGHVFEGEGFNTPTDKRYCINGTVLKFVPEE